MADFGINFKKARESKGLTLEQIAAKTKIGTRFLEAIEKDEFQRLPGGIFSRGFVRAYAESLGLDADEAVANFDRLSNYRPPAMEQVTVEPEPRPTAGRRKLLPIAIIVAVFFVIIFYFATRGSTPSVTADQPTPHATAPAAPEPVAPPPAPADQTPIAAAQIRRGGCVEEVERSCV